MRNHNSSKIMEAVYLVNPASIIPIIERGLEIEKLHFIVDKSEDTQRRINDAQVLLNLLHLRRLGI
jgi:hypothetical protein